MLVLLCLGTAAADSLPSPHQAPRPDMSSPHDQAPAVPGPGLLVERHPHPEQGPRFRPGSVIGIHQGTLSLRLRGADRIHVVAAAMASDDSDAPANSVPLVLRGVAPVLVRGPVQHGDLILGSTEDDGIATAIAPAALTPSQVGRILGRARESSDRQDTKPIETAIGATPLDLQPVVDDQQRQLQEQRQRLEGLEEELQIKSLQLQQTSARVQLMQTQMLLMRQQLQAVFTLGSGAQ
jgi:hypothetical protein